MLRLVAVLFWPVSWSFSQFISFFGQFSIVAASFDCFLASSVCFWPDQKNFCWFSIVAAGANCFLVGLVQFQMFNVFLWLV